MIDRIAFTHVQLANGIDCYINPLPSDFTVVYIQVARGTVHNTGAHLPGTFHFLEHLCCAQSRQYPQPHSYDKAVGMTGGWCNASTSSFYTTYQLSAPNDQIASLLPGLYSRVFEPVFEEETLQNQRQVVDNERLRRERWYPGSSEVSWYDNTQWQYTMRFPIRQVFGLHEDLVNLSTKHAAVAHAEYMHGDIRLLAVGPANLQPLQNRLEKVRVQKRDAPTAYETMRWVNQEFHVKHFRDMSRHVLKLGGFIQPPLDAQTLRQLRFILYYLTNSTHGALYQWLRHELGWTYGVSASTSSDQLSFAWEIQVPVNSLAQVEVVRRDWRNKALAALADEQGIAAEVSRLLGSSAYWNIHPQDIIDSTQHTLNQYGKIISDAEWREFIVSCGSRKRLQQLFDTYFAADVMGSYCAAPEIG